MTYDGSHPAFEEQLNSWNAGTPLSVRSLADKYAVANDFDIVVRLIECDLALRSSRDSPTAVEDYLQQFPAIAERLRSHLADTPTQSLRGQSAIENSTDECCGPDAAAWSVPQGPHLAPPGNCPPPVIADYELLRSLDEHTRGTVWLARSTRTRRPCAVRILNHAEQEVAALAVREARQEHPHLIGVYHMGKAQSGQPYCVLPLADPLLPDGQVGRPLRSAALDDPAEVHRYRPASLSSLLQLRTRLPPAETAELLKQILQGLVELHRLSQFDNDIRPSNIFHVGGRWQLAGIRLTALPVGSSPRAPTLGRPADADSGRWCDLADAGLTAFTSLTGQPAARFQPMSVPKNSLPSSEVDDRILRRLAPVINGVCSCPSRPRYTTAAQMLEAVENSIHPSRLLRRRAVLAAGLAGGAALLAVPMIPAPPAPPLPGISKLQLDEAIKSRHAVDVALAAAQWSDGSVAADTFLETTQRLTSEGLEGEWELLARGLAWTARQGVTHPELKSAWFPSGIYELATMPEDAATQRVDVAVALRTRLTNRTAGRSPVADSKVRDGLRLLQAEAQILQIRHLIYRGLNCRPTEPERSEALFVKAAHIAEHTVKLFESSRSKPPTLFARWAEYQRETARLLASPDHEPHLADSPVPANERIEFVVKGLATGLKLRKAVVQRDPEGILQELAVLERHRHRPEQVFSLLESEIHEHLRAFALQASNLLLELQKAQ